MSFLCSGIWTTLSIHCPHCGGESACHPSVATEFEVWPFEVAEKGSRRVGVGARGLRIKGSNFIVMSSSQTFYAIASSLHVRFVYVYSGLRRMDSNHIYKNTPSVLLSSEITHISG